jgi:hypothetical protein
MTMVVAETLEVYDPEGSYERVQVDLTRGRSDWSGVKVGVLDNTKQHARELMDQIAAHLDERFGGIQLTHMRKASAAVPADASQLDQLKECNLVLTGSGD